MKSKVLSRYLVYSQMQLAKELFLMLQLLPPLGNGKTFTKLILSQDVVV